MEQSLILPLIGVNLLHVVLEGIENTQLDELLQAEVFEWAVLQVEVALLSHEQIGLREVLLV